MALIEQGIAEAVLRGGFLATVGQRSYFAVDITRACSRSLPFDLGHLFDQSLTVLEHLPCLHKDGHPFGHRRSFSVQTDGFQIGCRNSANQIEHA